MPAAYLDYERVAGRMLELDDGWRGDPSIVSVACAIVVPVVENEGET